MDHNRFLEADYTTEVQGKSKYYLTKEGENLYLQLQKILNPQLSESIRAGLVFIGCSVIFGIAWLVTVQTGTHVYGLWIVLILLLLKLCLTHQLIKKRDEQRIRQKKEYVRNVLDNNKGLWDALTVAKRDFAEILKRGAYGSD